MAETLYIEEIVPIVESLEQVESFKRRDVQFEQQ